MKLLLFLIFKDPLKAYIEKCENCDSNNLIKNMMQNLYNTNFSFKYTSSDQTRRFMISYVLKFFRTRKDILCIPISVTSANSSVDFSKGSVRNTI